MWYRLLADGVLVVHTLFIFFVIGGLLCTWVGYFLHWSWVHNRWFRGVHLACIGLVVLQSWLGIPCPLTMLESELRTLAGQEGYPPGGFIRYWLHQLIFFQAPAWVFTLAYTSFATLVVASFWFCPVRWRKQKRDGAGITADC